MHDRIKSLEQKSKNKFVLGINSYHGYDHWKRVLANGNFIATHLKLNQDFVHHFAWLHDCCRENESIDPDHGSRAAKFAMTLYKKEITFPMKLFDRLLYSLTYHNKGMTSDDMLIGTCWDADRLELGRAGIYPDPRYMSTSIGKSEELIELCYERSIGQDRSLDELHLKV